MSRLAKIAILTLLICILVFFASWGVREIYAGYLTRMQRIADLEAKVQVLGLSSHPKLEIRRAWSLSISTTDRPKNTNHTDLRLVYGTNSVQQFEIQIFKPTGRVVTAWISDWNPRSEMSKFDEFDVSRSFGSNLEVVAKAHANESISMEFTVTFITE